MAVPLPNSVELPYSSTYWQQVESSLKQLSQNPTEEGLSRTILKYLNQTKLKNNNYAANDSDPGIPDVKELKILSQVLQDDKHGDFFTDILPKICSIALEMPNLFPSQQLKILRHRSCGTVELNRLQVACLVAHMFFCTILPCTAMKNKFKGHFVGDRAPTGPITFRYWHTSSMNSTKLYLKSLLNYFRELSKCNLEDLKLEKIIYSRNYLETEPDWSKSEKPLLKVIPNLNGKIGDDEGHVEMDFANKDVGFGTTGTQEELILGVSPESCPIVLFNETLDAKDAVLFKGMKCYGNFKGYAFSVRYTGVPTEQWNWSERRILAMDAYCGIGDEKVQLQDQHLKRELNKAYSAFCMVPGSIIDSGHWGCGAFGGNRGLKSMLQIMAASEADLKALLFFSFGNKEFNDHFAKAVALLEKNNLTVSQLWKHIKMYEKQMISCDDFGVLKYLANVLK